MTESHSRIRCAWANPKNPRYITYHDEEWGVPCHDERVLFEMLNLEGAQAGLSWETILNKRDRYRVVYDEWNPKTIAGYNADKVASLLVEPGIVRNRLKVAASIANAQAYLRLVLTGTTLDHWLWNHLPDGLPLAEHVTPSQRLTRSPVSDQISTELGKLGFKFVGTTIIYAYMQAIGMVNDHEPHCFRREQIGNEKR